MKVENIFYVIGRGYIVLTEKEKDIEDNLELFGIIKDE